ncbi:MAG: GNAT family N-acetyltransferase [Gammaproteobacteria bacterium]
MSDIPEILELAVDPLFADEKGVLAMEARVRVRAATTRGTSHLAIHPYRKALEEWIEFAGQRLMLRPIRGEDGAEHDAFVGGIDPDDLRFRFGREVRELPRSELARMPQIDYEREMAFIATVARDDGRSETVGEVRLSAEPDGARAEFAIVVRSDFQGKGLGRVLAEKMLRYCRERGSPARPPPTRTPLVRGTDTAPPNGSEAGRCSTPLRRFRPHDGIRAERSRYFASLTSIATARPLHTPR